MGTILIWFQHKNFNLILEWYSYIVEATQISWELNTSSSNSVHPKRRQFRGQEKICIIPGRRINWLAKAHIHFLIAGARARLNTEVGLDFHTLYSAIIAYEGKCKLPITKFVYVFGRCTHAHTHIRLIELKSTDGHIFEHFTGSLFYI